MASETNEPTVSVAALAAVVEKYEAECGALAEPLESDDSAFIRVAGNAEGAREVLRRVTANPPRVLTEARVAEVLVGIIDWCRGVGVAPPMVTAAHAPDCATCGSIRRAARDLGVALPGTEPSGPPSPRVRRPEPTPEGAALKPEFEGSLSQPSTVEANLKPGSNSAPDVVWEDQQLRFLSNGDAYLHVVTYDGNEECGTKWAGPLIPERLPADLCTPRLIYALARALAEAKREARKAAESMRERAELVLYEAATKTRHPEQRDRLLALGHTIRDLPLEAE